MLLSVVLRMFGSRDALCLLQGPFDVASKLNWKLFYAGENGVRDRFLDMWEYLASGTLLHLIASHLLADAVQNPGTELSRHAFACWNSHYRTGALKNMVNRMHIC